jgi:hypothetical protein
MGADNVGCRLATLNLLGNFVPGGYSQLIAGLNGANVASVIGSSSTTSDSAPRSTQLPGDKLGVIQDSLSGGTRKSLSLPGGSLTHKHHIYSGDTTINAGTSLLGAVPSRIHHYNIGNGATLDVSDARRWVDRGASKTLRRWRLMSWQSHQQRPLIEGKQPGSNFTADSIHGLSQIAYGGT